MRSVCPLSSLDEEVLRGVVVVNGTIPASQLLRQTDSQKPAEKSEILGPDETTVTEKAVEESPSSVLQVGVSSVASIPSKSVGTQGVGSPGSNEHSSSMTALVPSAGSVSRGRTTILAPSPTVPPQPKSPVLGDKRPASNADALSSPPRKCPKPFTAPLHPREITGMPAAIPKTYALEGPIDLESGLPRPLHLIPDLETPSDDCIASRLSKVRNRISNLCGIYRDECPAGFWGKSAVVPNPCERLKRLYLIIFGQNTAGSWKDGAKHIVDEWFGAREMLLAVIGVAVYDMVFTRPVPWGTPWDDIERFRASGQAPYFKEAARIAASRNRRPVGPEQDFLILRAAELQIDDPSFQNAVVRPVAKDLAEELEMFLRPQLEVLGFKRPSTSHLPFWNLTSAGLTDIFTEGLIVRGQLDVSPSEFRYTWIPSGREFDDDTMEHIPVTSKTVSMSITPLIECKLRPSADWYVVANAAGFNKALTEE